MKAISSIIALQDKFIEEMSSVEDASWWHEGRRKIVCNTIKNLLTHKKNPKILDVGCGSGGTSINFLEFGTVVGTDFSKRALDIAIKKGLVNVCRSTLVSLPLRDKMFDLITALDVIEHVKDDSKVLEELKNVLAPDGFIVITVPAFQFLWSEHDIALSHFRRYSISTLTKTLDNAGFKVIRISYFFAFLFPLFALYRIFTKFKTNKDTPKTTNVLFPKFIDKLFVKIMLLEDKLLRRMDFPFGISIICIVQKTIP